MKRASKIWLIILVFILPSILTGWGYEGHRRINYLASRQLKGPFGRFLMQHSDKLKLYGPVPDYIKGLDRSGYHHHFIDADFYDTYPFDNIPRDRKGFYEKYGEEAIKKWEMRLGILKYFVIV